MGGGLGWASWEGWQLHQQVRRCGHWQRDGWLGCAGGGLVEGASSCLCVRRQKGSSAGVQWHVVVLCCCLWRTVVTFAVWFW
jgi:hypothetical protein